MFGKKERTPQAKIILCKSVVTEKLYVGLFDNNTPLKFWPYDDFGPAAKDFFIELIKAYDCGYDIVCDFPVKTKEGKKILPQLYTMIGEPGTNTVHALNKRQAIRPEQIFSSENEAAFEIISDLMEESINIEDTPIITEEDDQNIIIAEDIAEKTEEEKEKIININDDKIIENLSDNATPFKNSFEENVDNNINSVNNINDKKNPKNE